MAFFSSILTPLQLDVLDALKGGPVYYLSGGSALAAGYLAHRRSFDIDLFVVNVIDLDSVVAYIMQAAPVRRWTVKAGLTYPGFRRFTITRGDDITELDIVHEMVHQEVPLDLKPVVEGVRLDAMSDLVANKLCAILGRSEVKDLVDLYFMAESGIDVLAALPAASRKDSGMDPAILAGVMKWVSTDAKNLLMVRDVTEADLGKFRDSLIDRLVAMAWSVQT